MLRTRIVPVMMSLVVATIAMHAPAFAASADNPAGHGHCSRSCLEGFVSRYLQALAARQPSQLPFAPNATFTENNVLLEIGDGLWGTANGVGKPEQGVTFADPERGQVAHFGLVVERDELAFFALRMKIAGGLILEAETLVNRRTEEGARGDPATLRHDPSFLETLPAARRVPAERMVALADGYFSTMQMNDGKLFTKFDPACSRRENGLMMAGDPASSDPFVRLSCAGQFELGFFRFDDRVREREFPLVDEERGVVLARGFIDHSGRLARYALTNGVVREPRVKAPHSWHFLEAFKIEDGAIRNIEAVFIYVPYGMSSPWTPRNGTHTFPPRTPGPIKVMP